MGIEVRADHCHDVGASIARKVSGQAAERPALKSVRQRVHPYPARRRSGAARGSARRPATRSTPSSEAAAGPTSAPTPGRPSATSHQATAALTAPGAQRPWDLLWAVDLEATR